MFHRKHDDYKRREEFTMHLNTVPNIQYPHSPSTHSMQLLEGKYAIVRNNHSLFWKLGMAQST